MSIYKIFIKQIKGSTGICYLMYSTIHDIFQNIRNQYAELLSNSIIYEVRRNLCGLQVKNHMLDFE